MIKLTLKGQAITKKNSQRILHNKSTGRSFIAQSEQYTTYETDCLWQLKSQYKGEPINSPVNVKCVYYMPTKRRIDLINLHSSVHDILVKAGVLLDDNCDIVVSTDGSRVMYDRDNPRVEIEIEEVEG